MNRPLPIAVALLGSLCIRNAQASTPFTMTWSDGSYGPDGPWHAIQISIGSSEQIIALYPGATWTSDILLSTLCDNTTKISSYCFGDTAGLFNSDESSTYDNTSIELAPNGGWSNLEFGYTNAVPINAEAHRALDTIDIGGTYVPDSDLIAISQGYQTYPGGKNYPLEVGTLSLGSPEINQTFTTSEYPVNGTFITSWIYKDGTIPSYSFGMHIGSPTLSIPGSLILGGYDQSRVIGNVSSQPVAESTGELPIQLTDISLGVASGGSPWNSSSVTGLLAASNSTLKSGLTIAVDPTNPYIYLPPSSCDDIAAWLPVSYNSNLGLYFWDTSSSEYEKIVTSTSYLAFTFEKNGVNTGFITINIPFALLNLTLENPLVTEPTQYFPCMGTDSDPVLGRAFLQAAFIGVQWSESTWFLAQAPGPSDSFIANVVSISENVTTILASDNSWEGTWSNYWTPLPTMNSSNTNNATSTDVETGGHSGLSTGAKAGIGVGCGVAALVIIAAICWFFLRQRRQKSDLSGQADQRGQTPIQPPAVPQTPPREIEDPKAINVHELNHDQGHVFQGSSTQVNTTESTQGWSSTKGSEYRTQFSPPSSQPGPFELSSR